MNARLLTIFVILMTLIIAPSVGANVPGSWTQSNVSGFGDVNNFAVLSLASFDRKLYAGTGNESGSGAQLLKLDDSGWTPVTTSGFGNTNNIYIADLIDFSSQLYVGTRNTVDGGQVWRSNDGTTWNATTPPALDPTNGEIVHFVVFNNQIYASTWSFTDTHGSEVWRSSTGDSGDWTQVASDGFNGDVNNEKIVSMHEFNGYLYAGTDNVVTGAEVWYTSDGMNWSQVNTDGFDDPYNWSVTLQDFHGYLYAGTYNYFGSDNPGAELWRCQVCDGTDWQQVPIAKGFGDLENRAIRSLVVYINALYAVTYDSSSGIEVWHSTDGTNWDQVNNDGFGDSNNLNPYWDNSVTVFNNSLYVGTWNSTDGGEIWRYFKGNIYLPLVMKDF